MAKTFVLSDESINSYGYRVLTSGIDLSAYEKNPILLYDHSPWGRKNMPIGKVVNLRKENGRLLGDPEFDEQDEEAIKVKNKVESGYLNAVSIGFDVKEVSSDKKHLIQGQIRPTVTKSKLVEVSITPLPSNENAVKLRKGEMTLTLSGDKEPEGLELILPKLKNNMKELLEALGLPADATEQDAKKAIEQLKKDSQEVATLKAQQVESILELGRVKGFITEGNEEIFKGLAEKDPEGTKALLSKGFDKMTPAQIKAIKSGSSQSNPTKPQTLNQALDKKEDDKDSKGDRTKWTFDDWQTNDPEGLLNMKLNNEAEYLVLARAYTGRKK